MLYVSAGQTGPGPTSLNQPPNVQSAVGQNSQKPLSGQLNIGPSLMNNQPTSLQSQLGTQVSS